jgi:sodium-dependent dicarboxylate transporter 2/3/5
VISLIGTNRSRLLIGTIVVMAILAFFIPTASARVACLVPIILGMISGLGLERKSRVAGMLMMSIVYLSLIWAMGIATGAAQNVYVNALMDRTIHIRIAWIDWLAVGAPYSIAMSIALYFTLMKMMAPTAEEVARSNVLGPAGLDLKLGPLSPEQIKLLIFSVVLLGFWATEKKLHSFDSSSVAIAAVALMLMPKIGVINWSQVQSRIPWGILVQLGVGVGLGTALLKTGAAGWLATFVVEEFNVQQLSAFSILAILWLFLILVHLGFSSGAA